MLCVQSSRADTLFLEYLKLKPGPLFRAGYSYARRACPKGAKGLSPGFQPWDRPPRAARPHKALPRSALVEKHPSAGLEVLKGRPDRIY